MSITDTTSRVVAPTVRAVREASENRYDRMYYSGSYVLNERCMTYRDPTTLDIHDLSQVNSTNYASLTDQYLLQRYAATYFAGMAGLSKLATDAADTNYPVVARGVYEMNCAASSNFNFGQLVAAAVNNGVTACLSDTIIATDDPDLAVGVVVEEAGTTQYASGTSIVKVLMNSGMDFAQWSNLSAGGGLKLGKLTETWAYNAAGMAGVTGTGPWTQVYTFTQKLPAGSLVLGYRARVNTAFAGAGVTTVTITVGWSGHTAAFSADATQSVTSTGSIASLSTAAGPQVTAEQAPLVTFAIGGASTFNAGNITLSVLYVAPEVS